MRTDVVKVEDDGAIRLLTELQKYPIFKGKWFRLAGKKKVISFTNNGQVKIDTTGPGRAPIMKNERNDGFLSWYHSKNKMGIGKWNPWIGKYVGGVVPNFEILTEGGWQKGDLKPETLGARLGKDFRINGYLITCRHCGHQFQSENQKKRYCSPECKNAAFIEKRREETIRKMGYNSTKQCPCCGVEYIPKTRRSPTCGKVRCRTAWSRQLSKS